MSQALFPIHVDAPCLANIQTVVVSMVNDFLLPYTYNLYSERDGSSSPQPNSRRFSKAIKPTIRPNLRWIKRLAIALGVTLWSSPAFALPIHSSFTQNLQNKSASYAAPPDAGTPVPTGGTGSRAVYTFKIVLF